MTFSVISSAVIIAGLFIMNIIMGQHPDNSKRLKIALLADLTLFAAGSAGAVITYIRCMNVCEEKDLELMHDSFLLFVKAVLVFSAAVVVIYCLSVFLSPKLYFLHFGFSGAAQMLLLIFTCIFSLLTRGDDSALYRYMCLFGVFLSVALSLCPAITIIRFLSSPSFVKKLTQVKNDKKEGRKKKKSLKKY